jgi:hypothetical protein
MSGRDVPCRSMLFIQMEEVEEENAGMHSICYNSDTFSHKVFERKLA